MGELRRVLVVGAQGGLGRAFTERLAGAFDVVACSRAELDVTRRNDVRGRILEAKPDVVVDAAGFADIDACEVDKWRAYLTNRDGAEHLARAAAEAGALLVYPSTDLVFDGARHAPYREEDSPNPLQIYGDTKLAGELAIMSHAPRHLILRTGWLYGPHGKSFLNLALEHRDREGLVLAYDDQSQQPTLQQDFVDAAIELVRRNQTGVWHVAAAGEATPFSFAMELFRVLGDRTVQIAPIRRGTGGHLALRPRYSVLDCAKLAGEGIRMRPWKDALRSFAPVMNQRI
jgi:dTDP-4-dehydrorhamnose reductase